MNIEILNGNKKTILVATSSPKSKAKSSNFKARSCDVGVRFTTIRLPSSRDAIPWNTDSRSFSEHFSAVQPPWDNDETQVVNIEFSC